MSLEQWIYTSCSTNPDETTLNSILESAKRHNEKNGITGMLFFSGGRFMQVLEGEGNSIQETYDRIVNDSRHCDVVLLLKDKIEHRDFEGWTMGWQNIPQTDLENFPQYAPYFAEWPKAQNVVVRPGIALELVKAFSKLT